LKNVLGKSPGLLWLLPRNCRGVSVYYLSIISLLRDAFRVPCGSETRTGIRAKGMKRETAFAQKKRSEVRTVVGQKERSEMRTRFAQKEQSEMRTGVLKTWLLAS